MTPPPALTARYMARFQCLGPACEDTCCRGWQVPIDRAQLHQLERTLGGSPAERAALDAAVARNLDPGAGDQDFAHIRLKDDGDCPFLAPTRLCGLQARHGEPALPQVCSTYPRLVARAGERFEVWGVLSCPEVARQALLHADALELTDAAPEAAPRWVPSRVLPAPDQAAPYERPLEEIRGAGLTLLSRRQYPVATRLFLLAYLGKETAPFFHRDVATLDLGRLTATLAAVTRPETAALWHRQLATMPPPRALTANLVGQLIKAPLDSRAGGFRALLDTTLAGLTDGAVVRAADPHTTPPTLAPAALWADYADRRQHWQAAVPGRADQYFENYARAFWLREWHTTSIDLLAHARRLLIRVALLRFLLFCHPSLPPARALPDPEARRQALDQAAVDVFYRFSRAVDHQETFLEAVAATVVASSGQTFAHSTFLSLV